MKHSDFIKIAENMFDNDKIFSIQYRNSTSDLSKLINHIMRNDDRSYISNNTKSLLKITNIYLYDNKSGKFIPKVETFSSYFIDHGTETKSIYAVILETDCQVKIYYYINN